MRRYRLKVLDNETGFYHCISRTVAGERLLDRQDQEVFRKQMWQMAGFCGVEILTYCILSNHFHLLVIVPPKDDELPDSELVRRYAILYGREEAKVLAENLKSAGARGGLRAGLLKRMNDLSFFMKELKLRFSIYYNKRHNRFGTLWAERFKSLLVESEGSRDAVLAVAAYIDLNPVRAGLCKDPKDYRFCGYAEAVGGGSGARSGIKTVTARGEWRRASREYRMVLFGAGVVSDRSREGGIDRDKSREVIEAGGKLPLAVLARQRVRFFSDGIALGTAGFIERLRREHDAFRGMKRPGRAPAAPVEGERDLYFARRQRG